MKKGKSILTRCLALVLALVLIVSSANLGAALKASAASGKEISYGKLMADTYELADWEVALLSSGLLDPHFGYCAAPTADDKLVSINEAGKKIVAKNHCTDGSENYWIPVSADISLDVSIPGDSGLITPNEPTTVSAQSDVIPIACF